MKFIPGQDLEYQLENLLNEGLEFGDNIRGAFVEFETNSKVQQIQHELGVVPNGFIVLALEAAPENAGPFALWATRMDEWTETALFCRSNATNLKARLFVL